MASVLQVVEEINIGVVVALPAALVEVIAHVPPKVAILDHLANRHVVAQQFMLFTVCEVSSTAARLGVLVEPEDLLALVTIDVVVSALELNLELLGFLGGQLAPVRIRIHPTFLCCSPPAESVPIPVVFWWIAPARVPRAVWARLWSITQSNAAGRRITGCGSVIGTGGQAHLPRP